MAGEHVLVTPLRTFTATDVCRGSTRPSLPPGVDRPLDDIVALADALA